MPLYYSSWGSKLTNSSHAPRRMELQTKRGEGAVNIFVYRKFVTVNLTIVLRSPRYICFDLPPVQYTQWTQIRKAGPCFRVLVHDNIWENITNFTLDGITVQVEPRTRKPKSWRKPGPARRRTSSRGPRSYRTRRSPPAKGWRACRSGTTEHT